MNASPTYRHLHILLLVLFLAVGIGITKSSAQVTFITSLSDITSATGEYHLAASFSTSGTPRVNGDGDEIGTSANPFKGTIDGHLTTITGTWDRPLFAYIENAVIKNVIIEEASVSTSTGNAGAIAANAKGSSRIYNCGVLGGSISGAVYTGSLVGYLDGASRVVNCFSNADITGGTSVGGIVGYNNVATNSGNLKTMVMNCMFYGDITEGTSKAPIYNGMNITNLSSSKGVGNFNYFRAEASYVQNRDIQVYNCALLAETRFLQRFEFFRLLLNSNRHLAAWWATGDAANKDEMAKWVMLPTSLGGSCPYPVLKTQGRYPSVVNYDAASATATTERNKGGLLGTLTVNIRNGSGGAVYAAPSGANITTSQLILNITDKDPDRYNFNYYKVQMPYYNDVGTGNYTGGRVVTGWKIVEITGGTKGSYTTGNDATFNASGDVATMPYNFAERKCTNKDLYSVTKRIFNQGAYFDVPEGVTAITIEPYWANAAYLADAYLDVTYNANMSTATNVTAVGGGERFTNGTSYDINGDPQPVYTTLDNAVTSLGATTSQTVYDNAVVLVGNVHIYKKDANSEPLSINGSSPYSVMSIDLDGDNEPDHSVIMRFDGRTLFHPVRYDFVNLIGLGMAQKTYNSAGTYNFGILQPKNWFEITNTATFYATQFEYSPSQRAKTPIILQGGTMEQWVCLQGSPGDRVSYFHVGGNVWFKEFHLGTHQDNQVSTPHPPVSVSGGDFEEFYLTGLYRADAPHYNDNAECYVNGGRFGVAAGAGMEGIGHATNHTNGNITWQIDHADIREFYGGGINFAHPAQGNINTTISNSHVEQFCGGPKFGDMITGRTIRTTATNCTFGTFFGAGYGGNSYNRRTPQNYSNITGNNGNINWNQWVNGVINSGDNFEGYSHTYNATYNGVATQIDYQFLPMSNNSSNVARLWVEYVGFSLATAHNVTNTLTGCTITNNFYGGGSLGKVDGPVTSTLTDCDVRGDVFGAGYSATLPTVEVMNTGGFENEPFFDKNLGVYLPATFPKTVTYTWEHADEVNSTATAIDETNHILYTKEDLTSLGTVTGKAIINIAGTTAVAGSVYGGGEESAVGGGVEVNMLGGTVTHDVYGGGALANTNTSGTATATTAVNLTGGTVSGDVYGGGLGDDTHAALVGGDVTVSLNEGVGDTGVKGCVVGGSIFGGNNVNGTPRANITVHVHKTQNAAATQIANPASGEQTAKVIGRFDVTAVYGGGNKAAYDPTTPWDGTTGSRTQVIIDGCGLTSIGSVYGGGNAAPVPEANVRVNGCFEIGWLFGGGNGAGAGNPGADVGVRDATAYAASTAAGDALADRAGRYGTGNATADICGGRIGHLFGGSNTRGNIVGTAALTLNETMTDGITPDCPIAITSELFGFGNEAPMDGTGLMTIGCVSSKIESIFGGAKAADVGSDITLNINSGTFGKVFGGNESGGCVRGSITVNVEETGCYPVHIDELYGCGDDAAYSVYGYEQTSVLDSDGNAVLDTNGDPVLQWTPVQSGETPAYAHPQVNIVSFTTIGIVYGGGYGANATVVGNPTVSIQQQPGAFAADIDDDGDGNPDANAAALGTLGTVFGGGNAAQVIGSTRVLVGTTNNTARIDCNVYGGGNKADVSGNTDVSIGKAESGE